MNLQAVLHQGPPRQRKRVLVAGGAGFIGSHLCQALLAQGHYVTCADNFHTGAEANLAQLLSQPAFRLLRHDITQPLEVEVDEIFNLASPASPAHYQQDPVRTLKTNVLGALNLLDLAKRLGARILQASTSEVYGDPREHPQHEEYWGNVNPIGPRACYNEGKRCAETLFFDYHRQHGVVIKVARIFNTYGPRMQVDDGRVIPNFIVQSLRGQPITIHGEGRQTRSFCFIADLVDGLLRLMASPAALTGPVNLGGEQECTVLNLARAVINLTGARSGLRFLAPQADDPRQRQPDLTLARTELGWAPGVPMVQGLRSTIAHFRALLAAPTHSN